MNGWYGPLFSDTQMSKLCSPDPSGGSSPDQEIVNAGGEDAGREATELVGKSASSVLVTVLVMIGSSVSKMMVALFEICVPVGNPALG
jgi:hypothetical protein